MFKGKITARRKKEELQLKCHWQEGARQTFLLRAGVGRGTRRAEQDRDRKEGEKKMYIGSRMK